jgi:predicted PurR-regulated permease PerM
MNDSTTLSPAQPRKWWLRALLMLLMAIAFHITAWVLALVALVQLVLVIASDQPHERLRAFGGALGRYLAQIATFVTFGSEELPFPFSDWPS